MKMLSEMRASRESRAALPARKVMFACDARQVIERAVGTTLYHSRSIDRIMAMISGEICGGSAFF
jgi:hypothetical protein